MQIKSADAQVLVSQIKELEKRSRAKLSAEQVLMFLKDAMSLLRRAQRLLSVPAPKKSVKK